MIVVLLFFGFAARIFRINERLIFFYDQAWISQKVYDLLLKHDLKLVGFATDLPGVFSGPLLLYIFAPIYYLSHFNVTAVAIFCVLINLLGGVLLFEFCRVLFKNEKIGLLALLFWMVSFAQLNFSKLIGIYSFIPVAITLFYTGLAIYIFQKKERGLVLSAVGYALAFQLNPYLIYLGIFYPILYFIYQAKIKLRTCVISVAVFIALSVNYYLSEIKWNFLGTKSLLKYFAVQSGSGQVTGNLTAYWEKLTEAIYYSFFSFNIFFAFLIFISLLIFVYKASREKKEIIFLYVWVFSTLPLFAFKTGAVESLDIDLSIFPALTVFFAVSGYALLSNVKSRSIGIVFVVLVILSNFVLSVKDKFANTALHAYQPFFLQDELKVINYTYQVAGSREFSICSVSAPLFVNTLWSYLYSTYGRNQYGFAPYWAGPKQEGTDNQLVYDTRHAPLRFLIFEPHKSIPDSAVKATILTEDKVSVLKEEKMFGGIKVQQRILESNENLLKDTQSLPETEKDSLVKYILAKDNRYSCYHIY